MLSFCSTFFKNFFFLTIISINICQALACSSNKKVNDNSNEIWYSKLPPCPCENPDKNGIKLNDGWAIDKGNINKYHYGANVSYRSYPFTKTNGGKSGQQCCYDINGKLITEGSGAGTPDIVSTCKGEDENGKMKIRILGILGHLHKDVSPWKKAGGVNGGWLKYNLIWRPDNRNGCIVNKVPNN